MKLKRAYTPVLSDSEIDQIISEAETNPPSDEWDFCVAQNEDLTSMIKIINKNGSISIDDF